MYNFDLITVLVDEHGEGLPVGWMISNREDSIALIEFFKSIKIVCGNITPKWFMSDDAEQYFNAWRGVCSENKTSKLFVYGTFIEHGVRHYMITFLTSKIKVMCIICYAYSYKA